MAAYALLFIPAVYALAAFRWAIAPSLMAILSVAIPIGLVFWVVCVTPFLVMFTNPRSDSE